MQAATQPASIVQPIPSTTTRGGLKVKCRIDPNVYPAEITVSAINILPHESHGAWNHTISPGPPAWSDRFKAAATRHPGPRQGGTGPPNPDTRIPTQAYPNRPGATRARIPSASPVSRPITRSVTSRPAAGEV